MAILLILATWPRMSEETDNNLEKMHDIFHPHIKISRGIDNESVQ